MIKLTAKNKLVAGFSLAVAAVLASGATGTVAWFTANRSVALNYSKVSVTSVANNLQISYTPLQNAVGSAIELASGEISATGDVSITDVSSINGSEIYRPLWTNNYFKMVEVEYAKDYEEETGFKHPFFSTFKIQVKNAGNLATNLFLDGAQCYIRDNDDDDLKVSDFARVSISKAYDADPATPSNFIAKTDQKLVFMDTDAVKSGTDEGKYADDSVTGERVLVMTDSILYSSITGNKFDVVKPSGETVEPQWIDRVFINDVELPVAKFEPKYDSTAGKWNVTLKDVTPEADDEIKVEYSYIKYDTGHVLVDATEGTDYFRSVSTDLKITADSDTDSDNFFCELGSTKSAWFIVTIWFEGTELAIQNAYNGQAFDLRLAFAGQDLND